MGDKNEAADAADATAWADEESGGWAAAPTRLTAANPPSAAACFRTSAA